MHDELDIPFDTVRLKQGGGHGGHNGIRDVAKATDGGAFTRVRVGIGRPPGRQDAADFVLKDFSSTERAALPNLLSDAADAVEAVASEGSWPRSSGSTRRPRHAARPGPAAGPLDGGGGSDQAAQEILGREPVGAGALHETIVFFGRELHGERVPCGGQVVEREERIVGLGVVVDDRVVGLARMVVGAEAGPPLRVHPGPTGPPPRAGTPRRRRAPARRQLR